MSSPTPDIVAVVDSYGGHAFLASAVQSALAAAGLTLVTRTQRELVDEVSVEQFLDGGPVVAPDRPLLWLSPGDQRRGNDADDRFLAFETATAARSIAMLTRSPVLNRPLLAHSCGSLPGRASTAVREARRWVPEAVRSERFDSAADTAAAGDEVYDYGRLAAGYGVGPDAVGPFRRRAAVPGARTVTAVLVGDTVVTGGSLPAGLLDATRQIARGYALDLAVVWWLVPPDGPPQLARIDCWLYDGVLQLNRLPLLAVAGALAGWLADRVVEPAIVAS